MNKPSTDVKATKQVLKSQLGTLAHADKNESTPGNQQPPRESTRHKSGKLCVGVLRVSIFVCFVFSRETVFSVVGLVWPIQLAVESMLDFTTALTLFVCVCF